MTPTVRPLPGAFMRLDNRIGWDIDPPDSSGVEVDEVGGELRLAGRTAGSIPAAEPSGSFAGQTQPTGLAVGPDGRLFLADPNDNQLLTYTTFEQHFVSLWVPRVSDPPDAYTLRGPRGVAFSRDGD